MYRLITMFRSSYQFCFYVWLGIHRYTSGDFHYLYRLFTRHAEFLTGCEVFDDTVQLHKNVICQKFLYKVYTTEIKYRILDEDLKMSARFLKAAKKSERILFRCLAKQHGFRLHQKEVSNVLYLNSDSLCILDKFLQSNYVFLNSGSLCLLTLRL